MAEEALTGVSGVGAVGTVVPDGSGTVGIALTGNAGVGAIGSVAYGESFGLTRVAAVGALGVLFLNEGVNNEGLALATPAAQFALTGTVGDLAELDLTAPPVVLALTGLVSSAGTLRIEPPLAQLQLTGLVGASGRLAMTMPGPQMALAGGHGVAMVMPRPQLALVGATGSLARLRLNLPRPSLALVGDVPYVGTLQLAPPAPRMTLTGDTGRAGRLVLGMKKLTLAMAGVTGSLGTLTLSLPVMEFDATGLRPTDGTLDLVLPAMQLQLNGQSPVVAGANPALNATTLVMQTERAALTQYTNYPFNSYCAFNGVFLGATSDGVFALTGDTDAGTAIAAAARAGITDFGTSHLKRIEHVYVGYRTNGRMVLRVITEETHTRDYAIAQPTPGNTGLHGAHARLGRGLEARYWQFELRNYEGSDFSLDMLEMKPTKLRRRVGGGNA